MDEKDDPKTETPKGWPIKIPKTEDIPYWVRCLIVLIAVVLAIFAIPAVVSGILYLSSDILSAYTNGNETNDIRSSILLLSASLGAIGIPLFIWRTIIAAQQSETARDRSYTELFTKAVEQLGTDKLSIEYEEDGDGKFVKRETYVPNIEVRIGAIFALERIMHDSDKDAPAILETLAAYVRENCGVSEIACEAPKYNSDQPIENWIEELKKYVGANDAPHSNSLIARTRSLRKNSRVNRADIETALKVLGRRPMHYKNPKNFCSPDTRLLDLSFLNLQGWALNRFDLSYCNLSECKLQGADLRNALLVGSDLRSAKLNGANLQYAILEYTNFAFAELIGVDVRSAYSQGAILVGAKLQCANIEGAQMNGADLSGISMQGTNASKAQLNRVNLSFAKMQHSNLSQAELSDAILSSATLEEANLERSQLKGVKIDSLRKAGASVLWVDFTKTDFEFNILENQLSDMYGHQHNDITVLPKGMKRPSFWSSSDLNTLTGPELYAQEWIEFKKAKSRRSKNDLEQTFSFSRI